MKLLAVVLVVLSSPLFGESESAKDSLKRYAELGKLSKSITKESSEKEVASVLGEPESKGIGGWNNPETTVWNYLNDTDDSVHRSFSVWFDPKEGCSVLRTEMFRSEIEKLPLVVSTGKVLRVFSGYEKGFICEVQFNRDGQDLMMSLGVTTLDRVKGSPKIGATVRVEYRGPERGYIFVGAQSLYLESIVFTDDEQAAPPSGP